MGMDMMMTYRLAFLILLLFAFALVTASPAAARDEIGLGFIGQAVTGQTRPQPAERLVLAVPRRGSATGVIVARSGDGSPITASVELAGGRLIHQDNPRAGLHDHLQLLYATDQQDLGPAQGRGRHDPSPFLDALSPRPIGASPVQAVLVHLHIPADAQVGVYAGRLTVRTGRTTQAIELEVEVLPFVVPLPGERRAWVDLLQSPDSVAYRYGVPLYSRQHLELMRPSMEMLSRVGQRVMHVTAIARTNFGNDESMIPIGPRGVDFSGFEGYMALFDQTVGRPRFVTVYAVEMGANNGVPQWTPPGGRRMGATEPFAASYGREHRRAWQTVMQGLRQRMDRQGWGETELLIGWIGDSAPSREMVETFKQAAPFARWVQFTHARGHPRPGEDGIQRLWDVEVPYRILPYPPNSIGRGDPPPGGGWDETFLNVTSMRGTNDFHALPMNWLGQVPHSVQRSRGYRGVARIGLDFWPVRLPGRGEGRLLKRFARWHNLQRFTAPALTVPGPAGALPTIRFLCFEQGAQETEAAIVIEQAMGNGGLPEDVTGSAAGEILRAWRQLRVVADPPRNTDPEVEQKALRALYELAGRIGSEP